ncbi:MAG: sigma-70 family RNA polymerase sigma factor [Bacteroidetes bacterium]|nr:sigma-70 family RNA polymerase sigma factor [Bacteroidota bacterium]
MGPILVSFLKLLFINKPYSQKVTYQTDIFLQIHINRIHLPRYQYIVDIIREISQGNSKPLYDLYRLYRNDFIRWGVNNYSSTESEAKDVFQEVIIRFYQNVVSGKLSVLTSDVKTYLWAIGKFQFLNLIKSNQRTVTFSSYPLINTETPADLSMENAEEEKHNAEMVKQHLSLLDEKSRRILEMYYLEGKDMNTIALEIGYKNADVAKKKKYEVMKKLASLLKGKLRMLLVL